MSNLTDLLNHTCPHCGGYVSNCRENGEDENSNRQYLCLKCGFFTTTKEIDYNEQEFIEKE